MMRFLVLSAFLFLSSVPRSHAANLDEKGADARPIAIDAAESELAVTMKAINELYKKLNGAKADPTQNSESAKDALQVQALFQKAQGMQPQVIKDLDPSLQPAALADYQRLIGQEIALAGTLAQNFAAGDNIAAAVTFDLMRPVRNEGHDKFKPAQ